MSLSSLQLDAFFEVAKTGSFSLAAKALYVTQSALSQRVANLEREMELSLFVRGPGQLRLTESGAKLLRHCQVREGMEIELNEALGLEESDLSGVIRIGGFSTVNRSVVMKSLDALMRSHPSLRIELLDREMRELPGLLQRGEVDFILLSEKLTRSGVKSHLLGQEVYVLIESAKRKTTKNIILDHDSEDSTSEAFFRSQKGQSKKDGKPHWHRSFLDDIYSIIDGVKMGWGRAVVPRHLVKNEKQIKLVKGYQPLMVPVYLNYFEQSYYTKLFVKIKETLRSEIPQLK